LWIGLWIKGLVLSPLILDGGKAITYLSRFIAALSMERKGPDAAHFS
jgi:hypothetical protein